jgi:hypothetical protein
MEEVAEQACNKVLVESNDTSAQIVGNCLGILGEQLSACTIKIF